MLKDRQRHHNHHQEKSHHDILNKNKLTSLDEFSFRLEAVFAAQSMQSVLAGSLLKKLRGTDGSLYLNLGCLRT